MPLIFKNARTFVLLLPLLMVLTACDGSNTNVDSTPPTVISFSPSDGAIQVARDSAITATFSEDMFAKTIGESSFIVASDSEVSGTVSFDAANNVATFEPDRDLALLVTYAATLSTAITDLSGNALATDQTWSFTTSDGVWGTAELIESDNAGDASRPQIAVDVNGKAFAVWQQSDGTRSNIVSNRFD
ncbi:Ig-like domain-containing protein, partial [Marinobacter gudaonensis]